jgi:uncharacterized integral membrane protein
VTYDPGVAINPDDQPSGGSWKDIGDSETVSSARKKDRDVPARLVVAVIALVLAAVFVFQNTDRVETKFLFFDGTQPLWFLILVSVLLGVLLGQAVGVLRRRKKKDDD